MSEPTVAEMARAVARELEDETRWCRNALIVSVDGYGYDDVGDLPQPFPAVAKACAQGRCLLLFGDHAAWRLLEAYRKRFDAALYQHNDDSRLGREYVRARLLELADALEQKP